MFWLLIIESRHNMSRRRTLRWRTFLIKTTAIGTEVSCYSVPEVLHLKDYEKKSDNLAQKNGLAL